MTRPPAVAGLFYDGEARELSRHVERLLSRARGADAPRSPVPPDRWRALLLPHAGYVYSGGVAATGISAVEWPGTVLLVGPNHTGLGRAAALSPAEAWRLPTGDVRVSARLTGLLAGESPAIALDAKAHEREHSIEVLLPLVAAARPGIEIACLCLAEHRLPALLEIGRAIARAVRRFEEETGERVAIVVSSDLSHFLPKEENGRQDRRALEALVEGDPSALHERVAVRERISMCGVFPATALLEALRSLAPARARVLAHADSADAGGEPSRVVGYAAVLWTAPEAS